MIVTHSTMTTMRVPADAASVKKPRRTLSNPLFTMSPRSAVGGWTPRPRKDTAARSITAKPSADTACATMSGRRLGSSWRPTMEVAFWPCSQAADT